MIARVGSRFSVTRRAMLAWPLACLLPQDASAVRTAVDRDLIAEVECADGLQAPFTLGIARVIVRPGAFTWSTTPDGVRAIVVESGTLAVAGTSQARLPVSSAELA